MGVITIKTKIKTLIGLNILVLLFVGTTLVKAPTIGTLYCCPSPDPIIDGTLGASEWKEGVENTTKLYNINNEAETLLVDIMSVQGTDLYLYFGVTIPDTTLDEIDTFIIVFRDVEGNPIVKPPYNAEGTFGADHDAKSFIPSSNGTLDLFTIETPGYFSTIFDTIVVGGTDDGIGKCHFNGTHYTIELRFEFNTGDTAGHDFNIASGSKIEIFLYYYDADKQIIYTQIRETTNTYEWIDLLIDCTSAVPISIVSVFAGLTLVAIGAVVVKKRK